MLLHNWRLVYSSQLEGTSMTVNEPTGLSICLPKRSAKASTEHSMRSSANWCCSWWPIYLANLLSHKATGKFIPLQTCPLFLSIHFSFLECVRCVLSYDRGEPAVNYRWTGWVWEITGWSSRLQENCRSYYRNLWNIPQFHERRRRMWTCNRLDLQTLGSRSIMSKNLPVHWCSVLKSEALIWVSLWRVGSNSQDVDPRI